MKPAWEQFIQDAIKLGMFLGAAYGMVWKALDTFEKIKKEKSVGVAKVEELTKMVIENRRLIDESKAENKRLIDDCNKCCDNNSEEIIGIKSKASEMLTIVLSYFKK